MTTAPRVLDPWRLVWGQPYIDSRTLAAAIEQDLARTPEPDYRTRLLIRDASVALRAYWGSRRFDQWLDVSPEGSRVREILSEDFDEVGYSTIRERLVDHINARELGQVFELLGRCMTCAAEIRVGGSIPTLIQGLTAQPTEVVALVDAVPEAILRQREVLGRLEAQFGLRMGVTPSHDLPIGWENRLMPFGEFGSLRVNLVDVYDIFVSKLSSDQKKHRLDVAVLALVLDEATARHRLLTDGRAFLDDPALRPQILENWRFIFQEPLDVDQVGDAPMAHE